MCNWRGVARVICHKGKHAIWIVHRGITIACAPEHVAHASDDEVQAWLVTVSEHDLVDTSVSVGRGGYLDIHRKPHPPGPDEEVVPASVPEAAAAQPPPPEERLEMPARRRAQRHISHGQAECNASRTLSSKKWSRARNTISKSHWLKR